VKGIAKDFEIVKEVNDVIVLEDQDIESDFDDDEWEAIDFAEGISAKRTYSAALSGR